MVRVLLFVVCLSAFPSIAQSLQGSSDVVGLYMLPRERKRLFRYEGTVSASATFTPGVMMNRDEHNFYLSGFAEYHINRSVSVRGDTYFHMNGQSAQPFLHDGMRTYFGTYYHLNNKYSENWDVRLGFQPGVSVMRKANYSGDEVLDPSHMIFSPSFSASIGFDYYVWRYFHFFANVAYVNSTMRGLPNGSVKADEILISAGLGFQIQTKGAR